MTTNNGRIYLISLKEPSHSYVLTNLEHDLFHGLRCLKGVARSGGRREGKRVYVPFEQIGTITEFDSWADYLASTRRVQDELVRKLPVAIAIGSKPPKKSKRRR